jgi:hypothetical protein
MDGLRVQIIPTIQDLHTARKHQFAAFIMSEQLLIVWDDDAMGIISRAKAIEAKLIELVWKTGEPDGEEEKNARPGPGVVDGEINEETGELTSKRPTNVMNSVLVSATLAIITIMLGAGFRQIAIEMSVDKRWGRLAFLLLIPVQVFFTLVCTKLLFPTHIPLKRATVLCTSYRRVPRPVHWTNKANARKLKVLFSSPASTIGRPHITAHHHSMSCIQRGSSICHCADRQVNQASHIHVRASRGLRKRAHQR